MTEMILVTGATGKVGTAAVQELRRSGMPVRAFVRNGERAKYLADLGAELAVGDLEDTASIEAALDGVTSVILVSPAVPAQELNVVHAASGRVGHVVKITSKASDDSPVARRRGQAQIEAGLRASGLPHTLLRANGYMQNTLALAPRIAASGGFSSAAADGKIGMIDARDVGAVAAVIAADPQPHADSTYWLTGPELITYGDVANELSALLGRPVGFQPATFEEDRDAMIAAGVPAPIAEMNAQAFELIAHGDAEWHTDAVPIILGRPARSYREFASDYAAAFNRAGLSIPES